MHFFLQIKLLILEISLSIGDSEMVMIMTTMMMITCLLNLNKTKNSLKYTHLVLIKTLWIYMGVIVNTLYMTYSFSEPNLKI